MLEFVVWPDVIEHSTWLPLSQYIEVNDQMVFRNFLRRIHYTPDSAMHQIVLPCIVMFCKACCTTLVYSVARLRRPLLTPVQAWDQGYAALRNTGTELSCTFPVLNFIPLDNTALRCNARHWLCLHYKFSNGSSCFEKQHHFTGPLNPLNQTDLEDIL